MRFAIIYIALGEFTVCTADKVGYMSNLIYSVCDNIVTFFSDNINHAHKKSKSLNWHKSKLWQTKSWHKSIIR